MTFRCTARKNQKYCHTDAFPNNTKLHSKTSRRPPFKNPSLVLVGKLPPSLVSKRQVLVPCTGNTSEPSDVMCMNPGCDFWNHWNHKTHSHQMKVHQYAEDRPETENHRNVMENFHEPRRNIFSQNASRRQTVTWWLGSLEGSRPTWWWCRVCLPGPSTEFPTHAVEGNPWSRSFPQMFCFSEKKTTGALLPRFSAKIGKKPFFTFSENGTLLITDGFCGGVPTQNGGWNNCSYKKLWNPCRTGEESFRSNGVKIRNLQKNIKTSLVGQLSHWWSYRCNWKIHRDQQIILMTSQILKFWSVDLSVCTTSILYACLLISIIDSINKTCLEVQFVVHLVTCPSSHLITMLSPFQWLDPNCTCKATSVAGLPGFKVACGHLWLSWCGHHIIFSKTWFALIYPAEV